jgi:hypothetical protein
MQKDNQCACGGRPCETWSNDSLFGRKFIHDADRCVVFAARLSALFAQCYHCCVPWGSRTRGYCTRYNKRIPHANLYLAKAVFTKLWWAEAAPVDVCARCRHYENRCCKQCAGPRCQIQCAEKCNKCDHYIERGTLGRVSAVHMEDESEFYELKWTVRLTCTSGEILPDHLHDLNRHVIRFRVRERERY